MSMMIGETQSPTALHKEDIKGSPIPQVVRINKVGLILVIIILASVFIIGFSSIPNTRSVSIVDTDQPQTDEMNSHDEDWIKNQSNAVPGRGAKRLSQAALTSLKTQDESSVPDLSQPPSITDGEGEKRRQQALIAALNSPISAPGIDTQATGELNTVASPTSINTDPLIQKLPLSDEQAVRLTHALESGTLNSDQNKQQVKQEFLNSSTHTTDKDYLQEELKQPISPYEVQAGTLIPAMLIGGINSDLPGQTSAQVRQNVYDSPTGHHLLIPQGAKLTIIYDSQISYGQKRVLVVVKRILFPNGNSMDLEGMPGVDVSGFSGLQDQVDNHYMKIFGSAAMLGTISAGFQLSQPPQNNANTYPSTSQVFAGAMGQQMAQVSTSMINKNLDIQPTLKIDPGYEFNIQVTHDMVFPQPYTN